MTDSYHLEDLLEDSSKEVPLSRGFMNTGAGVTWISEERFLGMMSYSCKCLKSGASTEDTEHIIKSNSDRKKGTGTQGPAE